MSRLCFQEERERNEQSGSSDNLSKTVPSQPALDLSDSDTSFDDGQAKSLRDGTGTELVGLWLGLVFLRWGSEKERPARRFFACETDDGLTSSHATPAKSVALRVSATASGS